MDLEEEVAGLAMPRPVVLAAEMVSRPTVSIMKWAR
jgi:hypothetical protein